MPRDLPVGNGNLLVERTGRVFHMHQRGRYADRYLAPHCWEEETGGAAPPAGAPPSEPKGGPAGAP
jgi:hypothetical protein